MRRKKKAIIFFVAFFFLSCIDAWCLVSFSPSVTPMRSSSSLRLSYRSPEVQYLPRSQGFSHGMIRSHNNTEKIDNRHISDTLLIAKAKEKFKGTDGERQQDSFDNNNNHVHSKGSGIDNSNNNSTWKNSSYKKDSLGTLTRDLLDANRTAKGSWTEQDCDKFFDAIIMWSKRNGGPGRPEPAVQQERLLRKVIEEKQAANIHALNLSIRGVYHEIIHSWSKSHETGSTNRAEEILDAMQHAYDSREDINLQPGIDAWNSILGSYAESKSKGSRDDAVRVFNKLYHLICEGQTDARPNDDSYAHILKAVASTGKLDAPKHVLDLLIRMENLSQNGFSINISSTCHNVYLSSLVESMKDSRVSAPETAYLAESYLKKMKDNPDPNSKPDRRSYNIVITGWSKSGDYDLVRNAETLLKEMETSIGARIAPNKYTYNCIIFCYTWSNLPDKSEKALAILDKMKRMAENNPFCRPDFTTYNAVMNCITKSNHPSAPYKVESLLEEMIDTYKLTGDSSMRPTNRSFNACVNAWARSKSKEAPKNIIKWINRFQDAFESGRTNAMPNKWTYNSYLQALAKQRKPSSACEAERILTMMEQKSRYFRSNNLKPDVLTYTNVLHCIALSESDDSFQRAYTILSKMENGDGDVRPNVYTYNVLINVVAKSKLPGKAKIAVQLVNRMKEVAIRPITITYNNALNACAYSHKERDDSREVVQVATMILKEAQETSGANYISYSTYLRVIRFFVYDRLEQWRLIRKTFRRCCEDGQLNPAIMKQIRPVLSPHQYGLLVSEATDKKTGRWREEYTINASQLRSKPLQTYQSIRFK